MKNKLLILYFFSTLSVLPGQNSANEKWSESDPPGHERKWNYILLRDTLTAKIIEHNAAHGLCGIFAFASSTIVQKENGDTLRILDLCNTSGNLKKGQMIRIAPANKPSFDVNLPGDTKEITGAKQAEIFYYDKFVLTTTWGEIL